MDVDRNALLEFEKRLGLKSKWVDVDSEQLLFDDNHFDTVVFSEVMEHLRFPQKALCEIARVLTKNGTLIGSVPNAFRMRNRWKFCLVNLLNPILRICAPIRMKPLRES